MRDILANGLASPSALDQAAGAIRNIHKCTTAREGFCAVSRMLVDTRECPWMPVNARRMLRLAFSDSPTLARNQGRPVTVYDS